MNNIPVDSIVFSVTYENYINQPINKGLVAYKEIFAPISLEIWLRKFENYIN